MKLSPLLTVVQRQKRLLTRADENRSTPGLEALHIQWWPEVQSRLEWVSNLRFFGTTCILPLELI